MRKIVKVIVMLLIISSLGLTTWGAEWNQENSISPERNHSLQQNLIRISVNKGMGNGYWADFKFVEQGDGTLRLKHVFDGRIYEPHEINENIDVGGPITIKFIDDAGNTYFERKYLSESTLRQLASDVGNVVIRYGLDHIQIIPYENTGRLRAAITGPVHQNFANEDFATVIRNNAGNAYKFRIERNGLHAHYINQTIIPDGNYTMEIHKTGNIRFVVRPNAQTQPNNRRVYAEMFNYLDGAHRVWNFTYDHERNAYKIKSVSPDNQYLAWNSQKNHEVIVYPNIGEPSDQFWHLTKAGPNDNSYNIVNARNKYMHLVIYPDNGVFVRQAMHSEEECIRLFPAD